MRLSTSDHDEHANGHVILRDLKRDDKYIRRKTWGCTWSCDKQAFYRIGTVIEPALTLEDDLAWQWCGDASFINLRWRANHHDRGYVAFRVNGRADRLVICAPPLLPNIEPSDGRELFVGVIPTLIDMGVYRMSRSRLWDPEVKGYEKLAFTRNTNTKEVDAQLADAGLVHGTILNPEPTEHLKGRIYNRLDITGLGGEGAA